MNAAGKGCLAGLISAKFGGGVLGTIILFIIVYMALGNC
jgi:hypothetical protein